MITYSFKQEAKNSLEGLEKNIAEEIIKTLEELSKQGFEHEKVKLIQDRNGEWLYRLKVMTDESNHRVFLDYIENEIKVLDVMHRDQAYEGKYSS
jgi:Plasmid stabilisation system protein.